jgi:Periplasmic binding protein-like domain
VDAPTRDEERPLGPPESVDHDRELRRVGPGAAQAVDTRLEEPVGIVPRFRLDVLGQGERHRSARAQVGEDRDRCRQGLEELLGARDPIPVARNRPEAVVGGDRGIAESSTCWRTGSGMRLAKTSPGRSRTGCRLTCATAAAVTRLVAPGPIDVVQTIIRRRACALANAMAACAIACSLWARKVGSRSCAAWSASPSPLRAARECGVRVPAQLAVVGMDDMEMSAYTDPPLTTVRIAKDAMERLAADWLIALIEGNGGGRPAPSVPAELIVRETCGAPDRRASEGAVASGTQPFVAIREGA